MSVRILIGDCRDNLRELADASVHCCVTSPPYFGLRDYGCAGQMGLEPTPDEFVAGMVEVFREVRRVLRDDGTLWLNIGDSYCAPNGRSAGGTYGRGPNSQLAHMHEAQEQGIVRKWPDLKAKDLIGIRGAPAVRVVERTPAKIDRSQRTHTKGRSRSSGTLISPPSSKTTGFIRTSACDAALVSGRVLDPFGGAGTTGMVANREHRDAVLLELNPHYAEMTRQRLIRDGGMLVRVEVEQ